MKLLALVASLFLLAAPVSAASYYVTINQAGPHYGDSVNFTELYPQDAAKSARNPQYHDQPTTQIDCYQGSVYVWRATAIRADKQKVGADWLSHTTYMSLGGAYNEFSWLSGAAHCYVTVFYFDVNNDYHFVAQSEFDVAA